MCEGFVSTLKQIGVYLNTSDVNYEMVVKTDGHGHINSIEVAVLCLLQKIINDNARSSKTSREIHVFRSLTPKLVFYSTVLHTQHCGPHSTLPQK